MMELEKRMIKRRNVSKLLTHSAALRIQQRLL